MGSRTEDLLPDLRLLAVAAVATGLALWLALSAVHVSGSDAPGAPRVAPSLDSPSAAPLAPPAAPARSVAPSAPPPTVPDKVEPFPGNTLDMPIDPPLSAAPWGPTLP